MSNSEIKKHGQIIKQKYRLWGYFLAVKLKNTFITANHVTLSRIFIMAIVSICILSDVYFLHILAAFLIILFSMFDALDGSLASLKNERTILGAWLDPQVDRLGFLMLFIVVGFYLSELHEFYVYLAMYVLSIFYYRAAIPADIRYKDKFILLKKESKKNEKYSESSRSKTGLIYLLRRIHMQFSPHTHNVALYIAIGLVFRALNYVMVYLALYLSVWYLWEGYKVIKQAKIIDNNE